MTHMRGESETLNPSENFVSLQREIAKLKQENKVLHIRAQGVEVLGKVLQDSQESNSKLKEEVRELKTHLDQRGFDAALADISVGTSINDDSQSSIIDHGERYYSSMVGRSSQRPDYINVTTVSGPQSLPAEFSSMLCGDFHIKELRDEFEQIGTELDQIQRGTQKLRENVKHLPDDGREVELMSKLERLNSKLQEYIKEARTRETLSSALITEEEKLKTKLAEIEAEQASHENVVHQLKDKLDESREEMEQLQDEIKLFKDAVFVQREQASPFGDRNEPLSISSRKSASRSLSDEGSIFAKTPLSQSDPKDCVTCGQLKRQNDELQRQLLVAKAEKEEALKLKEEVLDVNYKWDEQYKLLVAASKKDTDDLKKQIEMLKSGSNGHFTGALLSEKKGLEDRCKQLESEIQEKQLEINGLQLLMRNKPMYSPLAPQNSSMEEPPSRLSLLGATAPRPGPPSEGSPSWPGTTALGHQIPAEVLDQIEVLKQQLRVYADDFATEREDRERNQAEKEKLKEELDAVKEQLHALEQQLQLYEEDFRREKREKESLQQQLRARQTAGGYSYNDPLAHKARAVAEQQARVQAIKEVHDRERDRLMRGQHELQQQVYGQLYCFFPHYPHTRAQSQYNAYGRSGLDYTNREWKRPPLTPRGVPPPARELVTHPASQQSIRTSMYHGGEVYPDTVQNVIDSPSDGNDVESDSGVSSKDEVVGLEECPRCLRRFDGEDSDTVLKHIERCIS
ncbi:TNFAIP3-interacting protein 1-like [Stylophora pistillata]|uniref:TNFAIP3-interacting protein 1-like n=1 Tax=Stylophora pistillata TaxID=50429 RepID=UPI000C04F2C7|nr:TNFAIP3-interacting protein 1-like [Stylophora pistillata]